MPYTFSTNETDTQMFGIRGSLNDGRNLAPSPAFDHSVHSFKCTKREFKFAFNGTLLEV